MGYVEPPEYNEEGIRKVAVSQHTIQKNCELGMFVGETIKDMYVNEHGQLIIQICEDKVD